MSFKKNKSRFRYTKSQRSGIFLFLVFIVVLQVVYFTIGKYSKPIEVRSEHVRQLEKQIDSLKEIAKSKKVFNKKYNPNYLSDVVGYQLGMSVVELDRLFAHRKKGLWVNSFSEFQKVTLVSDSLLLLLKQQLYFPVFKNNFKNKNEVVEVQKKNVSKKDLNQATQEDLIKVYGIGDVYAKRILKYREKLQGFTFENQLYEVWGLDSLVVSKLLQKFTISVKPTIQTININTATFKEVLQLPYFDYALTKKLFNYRNSVGQINDLEELKKIDTFPIDNYDRIVLYLHAK